MTATCPAGEHIEVGGASGEFDVGSLTFLIPTDMHRSAKGKWTANGRNAETVQDALTAVAFCWDGPMSVATTVTNTVAVAPEVAAS